MGFYCSKSVFILKRRVSEDFLGTTASFKWLAIQRMEIMERNIHTEETIQKRGSYVDWSSVIIVRENYQKPVRGDEML